MKFSKLSGDVNWKDYGGKFVSKKLNNGEFDYWIVLEVINMHDATGDESSAKYYVTLQCVSPEQVSESDMDRAIGSCGYSDEDIALIESNPLMQVEALSDYGIYANLWSAEGNNIDKLMRQAHKECDTINMLFGFYMDRAQNHIGQSGWDLIRGQSMNEFFNA